MTRGSSREYIAAIRPRYFSADRHERSRLLTEAATVTGYHRKHILRLLHHAPRPQSRSTRHRPRQYTPRVVEALRIAWEACGYICSRRLKPFLPEIVPILTRVGALQPLRPEAAATLLQISPATIDRVLVPFRQSLQPRGLSTTKPGTLLLSQIPVRTFAQWDDAQPGFLEVDLVAHCGSTTAGEFAYTLSSVDVTTGWIECIAVPNRGQRAVFAALQEIRHRLPVPLRGLDSDNDVAFINDQLLRYCRQERITFTRCRPYRKNDQAHVEQKNWSVIRRLVGYDRYVTAAAVAALNTVYQHLRLYINFFQPSLKLVRKVRHGAAVHKTYDRAQTPYQRLCTSGVLTSTTAHRLATQYHSLNPLALRQEIDQHLRKLWRLAIR